MVKKYANKFYILYKLETPEKKLPKWTQGEIMIVSTKSKETELNLPD